MSGHFGADGAIAPPTSPLQHHLYVSLPRSAWVATAQGRHSWQFSAGMGSPVSIQSRKRNNEAFFMIPGARIPPADAWQQAPPASSQATKRQRPPSPAECQSSRSSPQTVPQRPHVTNSIPPQPTLTPFPVQIVPGTPSMGSAAASPCPPGSREFQPGSLFSADPGAPFAQQLVRHGRGRWCYGPIRPEMGTHGAE